MSEQSNYKHVYTGSEVNVQYLESILKKAGIHFIRKDEFQSGLRAGFGGGTIDQVQLLVERSHFEEAKKIAESTFPNTSDNEKQ